MPSTPVIQLPPQFAPSNPFRIEEISHYDAPGPGWYWNNISCGGHTGTHFDAPIHWVTGKDFRDGATDTIPVQRFVAPACVIDCSTQVRKDEKFLLEPSHIEAWDSPMRSGRVASRSTSSTSAVVQFDRHDDLTRVRAASGHAAAAPPRRVINSRRFIMKNSRPALAGTKTSIFMEVRAGRNHAV